MVGDYWRQSLKTLKLVLVVTLTLTSRFPVRWRKYRSKQLHKKKKTKKEKKWLAIIMGLDGTSVGTRFFTVF